MMEISQARNQALVAILAASAVLLWVSQCRQEQISMEKEEELRGMIQEIHEGLPPHDPFEAGAPE